MIVVIMLLHLPLYLDFTLGERRVVRIVCIELKTPTECESDGITYTIED